MNTIDWSQPKRVTGFAYVRMVFDDIDTEDGRGDRRKRKAPKDPSKWINKMRRELKKQKRNFSETMTGDGVLFTW